MKMTFWSCLFPHYNGGKRTGRCRRSIGKIRSKDYGRGTDGGRIGRDEVRGSSDHGEEIGIGGEEREMEEEVGTKEER